MFEPLERNCKHHLGRTDISKKERLAVQPTGTTVIHLNSSGGISIEEFGHIVVG